MAGNLERDDDKRRNDGLYGLGDAPTFAAFLERYGGLFDRDPGPGDHVRLAWLSSPLGPLLAGADDSAIRFLDFFDRRGIEGQVASLRATSGLALVPGGSPLLDRLSVELGEYFARARRDFSLPVRAPGSPFQERVWDELRRIPYGAARSYGELARAIGSPSASRAVGSANAVNRVALLIPCHRVINADGSLCGYAGGRERKRALLELEGYLHPSLPF